MAVGGEIKTVLSLDVSKFTSNLDRATSDLTKFDKGLQEATKVASSFEKSVKEMAGDSTAVSDKFKLLDQTITSFVNKLAATAEKLSGVTKATGNVKKAATDLGDGLKPVKNSLSAISKETDAFRIAMDSLKPSLQRAAQGNKDLAKAQKEGAQVAKQAAADTIQAKIAELDNEVKTNNDMIASRRRAAAELARLEQQLRNEVSQRRFDKEIRYFGRNVNSVGARQAQGEIDRVSTNAEQIREQTAAAMANVAVMERRNEEIAQEITLLRQQAEAEAQAAATARKAAQDAITAQRQQREEEQEVLRAKKEADRQAVISAREAAAARRQAAREAAQYERDQAQQIASMWKGMGQLWAASKIEGGLKSSVNAADDMQRQKVMVQSLNYGDAHNQQIYADSEALSNQLKFISNLDAIKARMSAIASVGYDSPVIKDTLETAVRVTNNLEKLGVAHGDTQQTLRNLYGVVEMRQQTADAAGTNRTMELLQKIVLGTQGKVQATDLETVMRRLGMGASELSDQGVLKVSALIDQFKVAGGDHGGGSSGVSTVGTMLKMFQSYALGKNLSNEAVKELSGAGVLNLDGIDLSKGGAAAMKEAKHAGFKDAQLWLNDPIMAIQKIMPQIIAYTQQKQNKNKYYEGRNPQDAEAQAVAIAKFLATLGITVTAQQAAFISGDPRSKERIDHQVATMNGVKSSAQVDADLQKTYSRSVQEMSVALTNLKTNVGATLLPVLAKIVEGFAAIAKAAYEFTKENPIATQFTAIAFAAGGMVLGLKGIVSMFGMFGGVSTTLRAVTQAFLGTSRAAIETAAATEQAAVHSASARTSMFGLSGVLNGLKGDWAVYAKTLRTNVMAGSLVVKSGTEGMGLGLRLLGSTVTGVAKLVGKAFLRMIPLVGELLMAWDFANLIAGLEVGGHQIKDWMAHLMDWLITKAKNGWEHIKDAFTLGMNHTAHATAIAANNKEYHQGSAANGFTPLSDEAAAKYKKDYDPELARMNAHSANGAAAAAQAASAAAAAQKAKLAAAKAAAAASDGSGMSAHDKAAAAAIAKGAAGKQPRQYENLFQQSLANVHKDTVIEQLRLDSLKSGDDSYRAQAEEQFKAHWLGGQFDDGHDPTKRKFMKKGAKNRDDINSLNMDDPHAQEWIAETEAKLRLADATKAVTFAKERAKATDETAKAAVDALTEGTIKQSAAMRALKAEFARANARTPGGVTDAVKADQASALANQQIIDSASYAAKLKQKNEGFHFTTNADGSEMDASTRILKEHADLIKKVTDEYAAQTANADANERKIAAAQGKESDQYKEAIEARKKVDEEYKQYKENLDHQLAEQLRTPLDKMLDDWKNVNDQIANYEVQWANSILGTIEKATTGGFKSFKDFKDHVRTMLADMLVNVEDMMLKNMLGDSIKNVASGIGDTVKGVFANMSFGKANQGQGAPGASGDVFGKMVEGVKGFWNSITGADHATKSLADNGVKSMAEAAGKQAVQTMTQTTASVSTVASLTTLGSAAQYAAMALSKISVAGGTSQSAGGLLSGLGGGFNFGTAAEYGTMAGSEQTAMLAAQDAGMAGGGGGGGFWGMAASAIMSMFADGGVMTHLGPVALNAYANGGVANGPQLALFGEGRMNEAYVPLPDGKTIPVTMRGGEQQQGRDPNNVRIVNVLDPSTMHDFLSSSEGEQVILNVMQRNGSAIRRALS